MSSPPTCWRRTGRAARGSPARRDDMPQQAEVDVVGLRALARDIARAGDIASPLNKVLKDAGLTAVSPIGGAVQAAIPQVETLDHEAGAMAGTVRIWSTRTGAGVRE